MKMAFWRGRGCFSRTDREAEKFLFSLHIFSRLFAQRNNQMQSLFLLYCHGSRMFAIIAFRFHSCLPGLPAKCGTTRCSHEGTLPGAQGITVLYLYGGWFQILRIEETHAYTALISDGRLDSRIQLLFRKLPARVYGNFHRSVVPLCHGDKGIAIAWYLVCQTSTDENKKNERAKHMPLPVYSIPPTVLQASIR